mmetsp:Transcript_44960/g.88989  ORF Transcript_44960/g.88989 Transcript_44960/m.88989 type:complete len:175 (-) Transcript_44960:92-616(-)
MGPCQSAFEDAGAQDVGTNPEAKRRAIGSAQSQIDRCLWWAGGVPFEKHQPVMKQNAKQTLVNLAAIMQKFPTLGLKVLCFTGNLPDSQALRLSNLRVMAVKDGLYEAGCKNPISCEGRGHADDLGARIEFIPCDADEISQLTEGMLDAGSRLKMMATGRACNTDGRSCSVWPF